jgi:hypothetical protein
LSIHYSGTIKDKALIATLTGEVRDVCSSLCWTYHIFDEEDFSGIGFSPPQCEPVFLTFNNSPQLASPVARQLGLDTSPISTKTQHAGLEAHMALLNLLKHLAERYFAVFELDDEGGYWETGGEEALRKKFDLYNAILNTVSEAMKDFKAEEGDTPERPADRLEKFLNERWKNKPII